MPEITVNASDYSVRRMREDLIGGLGSLDAKRPQAWQQYGYPDDVTFPLLRRAYDRSGPAHGAVHRLLDGCWMAWPRIKEPAQDAETPWEASVAAKLNAAGVWRKLRDMDRRNMIGHYSGLIYRVADGLPLKEPMVRGVRLVDVVPVDEGQLRVTGWDSDSASPTFGQPLMWQYRMRQMTGAGADGRPDVWADVHPSRIQILAEGSVGDFLEGVPLLRAGFNALIDLEKVAGGSAESFLKNSARSLVFKFGADAQPQVITQNADGTPGAMTVGEVMNDKVREMNRNQDAAVVIQGGDATTLQTTISDPSGAWALAGNIFAASVRMPFTIIFGQQTGRLASDEDRADLAARCMSRRANELTPMIEEFIRRMQAAGCLDAGAFEVEWGPLDAPGEGEKATLLGQYAIAMKQAFDSGLTEPLFDANELRAVVGYEPRTDDGMPDESQEPVGSADPTLVPVDPLAAAGVAPASRARAALKAVNGQ